MAVWCNILDLSGVNAWILYKKETGNMISRWDFMHTLAMDLINPEIQRRQMIEHPIAGHYVYLFTGVNKQVIRYLLRM